MEMTIIVTSTPMASGFSFGGFVKSDVSPSGGAMAGPFSMASIMTICEAQELESENQRPVS